MTTRVKKGRPPLAPEKRRGASLGFRPTPEIRAKLEEAAAVADRSLSQEIESRLERSFEREESLYEAFGGRRSFTLGKVIANVASLIESSSGKNWRSHRQTFEEVRSAVMKVLEALGPTRKAPADNELERQAEILGEILAGAVTEGSSFPPSSTPEYVKGVFRLASGASSQARSEAKKLDAQLERRGKATSKKVSGTSS